MKLQLPQANYRFRAKASALHFCLSLLVAALAATLVFWLWFPWPYRVISGGQELFWLLTSVDVVLGPLLTFAVFDAAKGRRHLQRDLAVIVLLQLAALTYGLHTVYQVRPIALVFEVDRFRVITPNDVHLPELPMAPEQYQRLPLTGPWILGTRAARDGRESTDALIKGFEGIDVGQRPIFWQPFELSKADALKRARPLAALMTRYPARAAAVEAALREAGVRAEEAKFLPVVARRDWVAVLTANGDVATFLPLDGFF